MFAGTFNIIVREINLEFCQVSYIGAEHNNGYFSWLKWHLTVAVF